MRHIVTALLIATALQSAKKKSAPPDEPPGHVHNAQEGMDMITAPTRAILPLIRSGNQTTAVRDCFLASDLTTLREIWTAVGANDEVGVRNMISSGSVRRLSAGDPLLLLEVEGLDLVSTKVTALMKDYSYHIERMITACGNSKHIDCRFPLAPPVIRYPLVYLKFKVRVLAGNSAEAAGWLNPRDLPFNTNGDFLPPEQ